MKVLVAAKRVVDPNLRIAIRADGSDVDATGLKTCVNPFDEVAIEQAVRLKEAGLASEVVLVSVGPSAAKDTLRAGLALGADRAILIEWAQGNPETLAVAKLLAAVARRESADMVILGKQSIDNDAAQCGPMLAGVLGWPQASLAASLALAGRTLTATCDTDDGADELELPLPCVVTAELRLAEPRYATLPNVMTARRKPLETVAAGALVPEDQLSRRLELLKVEAVDTRRHVQMLKDTDQLAQRLKELLA